MLDVLVILILLGAAYAGGYVTRDRMSRKRRESARRWKNYVEAGRPMPANTNRAPVEQAYGDLGQMLNRWDDRARARRSQR